MGNGLIDLYAQRMQAVSANASAERQAQLDRIVVTQPFGRAFTAQPSYPPDPSQHDATQRGGLAGLRRRLSGSATPSRKLATS